MVKVRICTLLVKEGTMWFSNVSRLQRAQTLRRGLAYFEGGKLADGTIFRRPLPAPSVELSSMRGTILFSEALQDGTARCFFRLMEQLHTQNEPEYCGLATLVTVLNALNIDPHRRWKGNWRFYSEEILECCEPLSKVKEDGINFDKLAGLARCNGLQVDAVRATETTLESFRKVVIEASQSETFSLALAYSRKVLNQTGSGHYSPMGAYHAKSDHLLILDCARFKYRPHWVSVPLMFDAMKEIDADTNKSRGYMIMSPLFNTGPPPAANVMALTVKPFVEKDFLADCIEGSAQESCDAKEFLIRLSDCLEKVFAMDMKGHSCGSPTRRRRIVDQLNLFTTWDEPSLDQNRMLTRKALVLSLEPAFISLLLKKRPDLEESVLKWLTMPTLTGELAVELSFIRPQMEKALNELLQKLNTF